jgi:hypothetical protein
MGYGYFRNLKEEVVFMTEPVKNKNWWFSNFLKTIDIYHNQFFEIWRVAVMNP